MAREGPRFLWVREINYPLGNKRKQPWTFCALIEGSSFIWDGENTDHGVALFFFLICLLSLVHLFMMTVAVSFSWLVYSCLPCTTFYSEVEELVVTSKETGTMCDHLLELWSSFGCRFLLQSSFICYCFVLKCAVELKHKRVLDLLSRTNKNRGTIQFVLVKVLKLETPLFPRRLLKWLPV